MNKLFAAFAVSFSLFVPTIGAQAATVLDGETVRIDYAFPDVSTIAESSGNVVVGAGVEYTFFASVDQLSVDLSGDLLTITTVINFANFQNGAFNGVIVNDVLGAIDDFTGFSIISSTYGNAVASFDINNLFVNFAGSGSTVLGDSVTLRIETDNLAAVPLPAGGLLLVFALGAMALTRRKS